MTLSKSARYALTVVLEMALSEKEPVTVADVARRHGFSATALAKVLQHLVRVGVAVGVRGVGGGYLLARPASSLTVMDVILLFERPRAPEEEPSAEPSARSPVDVTLRLLFDEVDELVSSTYASVTIETLAKKAGLGATPVEAPGRRRSLPPRRA